MFAFYLLHLLFFLIGISILVAVSIWFGLKIIFLIKLDAMLKNIQLRLWFRKAG